MPTGALCTVFWLLTEVIGRAGSWFRLSKFFSLSLEIKRGLTDVLPDLADEFVSVRLDEGLLRQVVDYTRAEAISQHVDCRTNTVSRIFVK